MALVEKWLLSWNISADRLADGQLALAADWPSLAPFIIMPTTVNSYSLYLENTARRLR